MLSILPYSPLIQGAIGTLKLRDKSFTIDHQPHLWQDLNGELNISSHLHQALLDDLGQASFHCLWANIQCRVCQQVLYAHQRHPHHLLQMI